MVRFNPFQYNPIDQIDTQHRDLARRVFDLFIWIKNISVIRNHILSPGPIKNLYSQTFEKRQKV